MEELSLNIIDILARGTDAKSIRMGLDRDVSYRPGQYLMLTIEAKGKKITKPLSISSSPTEKGYIEFTKKLTGSPFSDAINAARIGDNISVKIPLGKFVFDGQFEKAAFLSGGIGITPIRSMLKYATDKKCASSLILLYSGRTPEHLIFKTDFDAMRKENGNLKTVYTVTDCGKDIPNCKSGRIDAKMIADDVPDYRERRFFICGPPAMVGGMRSILMDNLSVDKANIFSEDFFGYQ
jgi:ferredoxin-NADP reductase